MGPLIVTVAYQTFSTSVPDCRAPVLFYDFM